MRFYKKKLIKFSLVLIVIYVFLLVPEKQKNFEYQVINKPFAWNKDTTWIQLENVFQKAKLMDQSRLESSIDKLSEVAEGKLNYIENNIILPEDTILQTVQETFFSLAPLVAAQKGKNNWLIDFYSRTRIAIKKQSINWDISLRSTRNVLYQLLYGMRAAIEEVLLASDMSYLDPVMLVSDEPSATLSTSILGIKVHSGDLLVSRGGTEVSALISRGNDYPGNFSHVAIIYIDPINKTPYLIEAHIEKGVAVASVEEYIRDRKLRFMVLRPRADLPQLIKDPMLPHKAAKLVYEECLSRHIPYDFKMNFHEPSAMFCSEVCSHAYKKMGINLWEAVSTISSKGVVNWLHAFGVENFVTQMPSDLEYDPQLSIVAEWRDKESLLDDHIYNAVIDVLYESADNGAEIKHNKCLLPFVRAIKGYCMLLNMFGKEAIIPEGMSATQALKNNKLVKMHASLKRETEKSVEIFRLEKGYTPPYWQLINLAKIVNE